MRTWYHRIPAALFALCISAVAQTAPQATLHLQQGHSFLVDAVAFSPNGLYALTGAEDGNAILWEIATGRVIRRYQVSTAGDGVLAVAMSPGGGAVLTGSRDGAARMFDSSTSELARVYDSQPEHGINSINALAVSSTGRYLATAELTGVARIWDGPSAKLLIELKGHTGQVTSVAFSPDEKTILTGSLDNQAILWDRASGQVIRRLPRSTKPLSSVAFSADGLTILTAGEDHVARLWNAQTGTLVRSFVAPNPIKRAVLSQEGRRVYCQTTKSTLGWNIATGQLALDIQHHGDMLPALAVSPDGKQILTAGGDRLGGSAIVWDAATGAQIRELSSRAAMVMAARFSPDSRTLVTGSQDGSVATWNLQTGQQSHRLAFHEKAVMSVDISSDSLLAVSGSSDGTAVFFELQTGKILQQIKNGPKNSINQVAFIGNTLVVTASDDGAARAWSVSEGKKLAEFVAGVGSLKTIAFSPAGGFLLTGGEDKIIRKWPVAGDAAPMLLKGHEDAVNSIAISADGHQALSGSNDGTSRIWNLVTGEVLDTAIAQPGAQVVSVAISPDQQSVLIGTNQVAPFLWKLGEKSPVGLVGHDQPVDSVCFSPDGRFAATTSHDGTTRLWNARTGEPLATLVTLRDGGWAVVDTAGHFDASDLDGGAPLYWIVDNDPHHTLPFEIFMRDYYTPGMLARIARNVPLPTVASIASVKNRLQPNVPIISASISASASRADIIVHAASALGETGLSSGLQDLRLFRNGQLVGYLPGPLKDGDYTFPNIQLPTSTKSVTFTAYAFNSERIKSPTASEVFTYAPPAHPAQPHAYLLQIGVNHYAAANCELKYSANDADKLSAVLVEKLKARNLLVEPVVLTARPGQTGDLATKQNIADALKTIAQKATPDDVFILSFSGHGYSTPAGDFYILPSDIRGDCHAVDDALLAGAISADTLAEWLRPIDAGEMTFILDSCFSAQSVQANDFKPGPMGSRGLGQLAYDKRIRILAASQSAETAGEYDSLHQGLLSYVLTEQGLVQQRADWKPKNGEITLGEWLSYAADAVPRFDPHAPAGTDARSAYRKDAAPITHPPQVPAVFDFSKSDTFVLQAAPAASGVPLH